MNHRIVVLIPYFGAWPRWFDLYLETIRHNPQVDWIFFTDIAPPALDLPNLSFQPLSLTELNVLAQERLGVPVDIASPFKVCDFRPAFGHLFEEYLAGYDFWGWGDIDVLYGNLSSFLADDVLADTDAFSCRDGFLAGEFSLLRNTPMMKSLYRESKDYRRVFASAKNFNFSEFNFFTDRPAESITHVLRRAENEGRLRTHLHTYIRTDRKLKGRPFELYWKEGQLRDLNSWEPLLLYHFIDNKKRSDYSFEASPEAPNGWILSQNGVYPAPENFMPKPRVGRVLQHRTVRLLKHLRNKVVK